MTTPETILPPQYDPQITEAKWQKFWQEKETFKANPDKGGETYAIVIPPPNVTGTLHMGHAFNTSLIDTLVRYNRMKGRNTLCLPGTDHASIAVQTIIEKQLKAEGKTRYDLGREKFLEKAWEWRHQSGGTIVNQLQRLGLSADWSRERFTLDENLCDAVKTAFVQLYEEGLIYRGQYMVNWCPESQSAVSDLEVENKEVDGHLWHFRYPLTEGDGYVEVATTRPETMLGDTAVAVNPYDERYQDLIGKTVTLPITNRQIPIIADEFVDRAFGTGCVKVTPAHDYNDFQIGKRHDLPFINILNKDGSINEEGGEFAGQDRFVARKNVVKRLEEEGFLVKVEDYRHSVPYSDRGKVPVEPLLSTQWFVKIEPLAKKALAELDDNQSPHFVPERWEKVYRDWLVKLQDWCISRQLWWGHQIPAWYVTSLTNGEITDETPFVVAHDEKSARDKAVEKYGEDIILTQDPDVLDTWFSSGLWPFSTMGWPNNTDDFNTYFPNTTMVTGFDIIFFWVARMTMMSGHFTGKMPFKDVYIHGLVRDENGKKMSKSANNGIDPLLLCNKYGTDALRYTLIREVAGAGQDISLQYNRKTDESESVEASRNFANKLWNAARFVLMNLDGKTPAQLGYPNLTQLEGCDRWILSRFNQIVKETETYLDNYGLGEAAKGLYEFIWGDFCDWYIELVKTRLWQDKDSASRKVAQQTLAYVLEGILKLLHPFMPHITEEIWHTLTQNSDDSLALQSLPVVDELMELTTIQKMTQPSLISFENTEEGTIVKLGHQVVSLLDQLPEQISSFLRKYQQPFTVVAIAFLVLVVIQLISSITTAIHDFPLLSPFLRLIGLGYTGWFIYQNFIFVEKRQETLQWLANFKEEIFGNIQKNDSLIKIETEETPSVITPTFTTLIDEELETSFSLLFETIRAIRNLRAEAEIKPGVKVNAILQSENPEERQILQQTQNYIIELAKVENLTITDSLTDEVSKAIASVVGTIQILIPLEGIIDIEKLTAKLEKKLSKIEGEVKSLEGRLNNPNFVNKAPNDIIENARNALAESKIQGEILQKRLELLK
ncbi:valine--tRNA ligase [Cyanobacterium aponinum UTEX 3221]|uniref:valine--tRNA ligase n=1 Tax=Cyanobacterium aponinum TaxID=379064 RepID=UPI0016817C47|nr:valine--tRNA ligase [Cyanobacterium aponinum]MBD2393432.1 valine--tRNA ligase [Cyanobacterium aponinum FACHB-4101]WRL38070.1 valine--tRNA ligase [Cyanobacterium aponinum UTEX 3221]